MHETAMNEHTMADRAGGRRAGERGGGGWRRSGEDSLVVNSSHVHYLILQVEVCMSSNQ